MEVFTVWAEAGGQAETELRWGKMKNLVHDCENILGLLQNELNAFFMERPTTQYHAPAFH